MFNKKWEKLKLNWIAFEHENKWNKQKLKKRRKTQKQMEIIIMFTKNNGKWNFSKIWSYNPMLSISLFLSLRKECRNPTLKECEDDTHIPEMGTWESSETPKNSELDFRGQITSSWNVFYTIEKLLKRRCRKWPRMSHSDIYSTSYVWKKGRESNWQFDSRPLKVGNWLDFSVCRWIATHRWKALKESYKFASDLIPIEGLSKELWAAKFLGVQIGTVSRPLLGSPGKKCHSDVGVTE
jgi:hypothetical protein